MLYMNDRHKPKKAYKMLCAEANYSPGLFF